MSKALKIDSKRLVRKAVKTTDAFAQIDDACRQKIWSHYAPKEIGHYRIINKWGTHLDEELFTWTFGLFETNMRQLYSRSSWGWDSKSKKSELQASTSRYLFIYPDSKENQANSDPVAFTHYRFDLDEGLPVVYCYEIQVAQPYQHRGLGSVLLGILEQLARVYRMEKVMATVFRFNEHSARFFERNGFTEDESSPEEEQEIDYMILSKAVN